MLFRKIQSRIQQYLKSDPNKVLIVSGARQVGKTYIIRDIGGKLFRSYVEINLLEESLGAGLFKNVRTVEDFYLALSMKAGNKMRDRKNTLIFLDEI